jgi:methyl-accepting chemotaxis protein
MKWFLNLKTATKLISSFVIVAILTLAVGIFAIIDMGKLTASMDNINSNYLVSIEALSQASINARELKSDIRSVVMSTNNADKTKYESQLGTDENSIKSDLAQYANTPLTPEEKQIYGTVPSILQNYSDTVNQIDSMARNGKTKDAVSLITSTLSSQGAQLNDALTQLTTINDNGAKSAANAGHSLATSSRNTMIVIIAISILLSLAFGFLISRIIVNPLARMVKVAGEVAGGDLRDTIKIDTKDEVGQLGSSLNTMIEQLRETMSGILIAAQNVSAASEEISAATEQIASGSTNQASTSETVNELVKQLSEAIQSVAESAQGAADLSEKTTDLAHQGEEIIRSSIAGMNKIQEDMDKLNENSNRVGEIIEVIDDVADQTNLLALNAAIEAARAGEQGRGFAVVADEVRKLAERTGEATKQITAIIKAMQESAQVSVKAVAEGAELSQKSEEAFTKIVEMVNDTSRMASDIAAASEEQAAQSSEVLSAVGSIAAAAEQSAASCEETASSSQSLAQIAEELNGHVSIFKVK